MIYILDNIAAIGAATFAGLVAGGAMLAVAGRDGVAEPGTIITAIIAEFWLAAILAGALILAPAKAAPMTMAFGTAFIIWIGFIVPAFAVSQRSSGLSWRTTLLDCVHWLLVMIVQVMVLISIGLMPPGG